MNNLTDISMYDEFSAMLGYTREEILHYFSEHIEDGIKITGIDREEYLSRLRDKYDGYQFSLEGKRVYNPVSIGSFFKIGGIRFDNYWADTGNTSFVTSIARKIDFNTIDDLDEPVDQMFLQFFDILRLKAEDVNKNDLKALLWQTGYLSIKRYDKETESVYIGFPNMEVAESFNSSLLKL